MGLHNAETTAKYAKKLPIFLTIRALEGKIKMRAERACAEIPKRFCIGGIVMNKTELVDAVAKKSGASKKDSEAVVNAFIEVVGEQLKKGEKIQLIGFGTFEVATRAAREGRNPQTGKTIKIAASKSPKFKAGKALKDIVNSGKKKK